MVPARVMFRNPEIDRDRGEWRERPFLGKRRGKGIVHVMREYSGLHPGIRSGTERGLGHRGLDFYGHTIHREEDRDRTRDSLWPRMVMYKYVYAAEYLLICISSWERLHSMQFWPSFWSKRFMGSAPDIADGGAFLSEA